MDTPAQQRATTIGQRLHTWFARQLDDRKPTGAIASLDGVRGMAFMIVLLLHVSLMTMALNLWQQSTNPFLSAFLMPGFSGVTHFFVLSGFLLFLPYTQAFLLQKSWPSAKIFYMRRVLRIFPAYFFSLFILVVFSKPTLLQPHNWKTLLPFLTFTMSYGNSYIVNGPYWTLATEFQYYLVLPLITLAIYGLTRLVRPERRFWIVVGSLGVMILWGLGTRRWGESFVVHPHALMNKVLFVIYGDNGKFFEDFAVGMLLATCYTAVQNSPRREQHVRRLQRLAPWLLTLGVLLYAFASMRNYAQAWHYSWSFAPNVFQAYPWTTEFTFALSYGCAVCAVLFNRPGGLLRRFCEWTPLRWIGLISYSLYIWHEPLLQAIQNNIGPSLMHLNSALAIPLSAVLVFGVAVVFCFFSYRLIELPGMKLSERLRQQMLLKRALSKTNQEDQPVKKAEMVEAATKQG
jgi:peptidoglycan/LPS O-acetylase OafA/YrhL